MPESQEETPRCSCDCGCTYELMSTASTDSGRCFSCRKDLHYGRKPVPKTRTRRK